MYKSVPRERNVVQVFGALMLIAILGTAAALWSDNLKIKTEVYTGDVDVEFGPPDVVEPPEFEGKDVGACSAQLIEIEDEDAGNPTGNNDTDLLITLSNAYPSYRCSILINVTNTGSIPVKGPHILSNVSNMTGAVDVFDNFTEVQIHPGDYAIFNLTLHVLQGASENETYTMQLVLQFHQWNEEP